MLILPIYSHIINISTLLTQELTSLSWAVYLQLDFISAGTSQNNLLHIHDNSLYQTVATSARIMSVSCVSVWSRLEIALGDKRYH